jgi:flagellar biosynthetic protein FliR
VTQGLVTDVRPFDLFAPGSAAVAALVAMRMTGLMLIAPVFSAKTMPIAMRTALIVVFTVLVQPFAYANLHGVPAITPLTALGETMVGFAIGLGAALLVGAAEAAGDLIAIQIGLSGATLLDPMNHTSAPVLANFFSLFTVTVMLALNVHVGMLEAVGSSLRAIPVGSALDLTRGAGALLSLAGSLFMVGLRFAAPVIATVMIGNAALAVMSRAAPQLNILSVAFPLQIGLGLFALGAALPLLASYLGDWPRHYDQQLTTLFGAFAAGAR